MRTLLRGALLKNTKRRSGHLQVRESLDFAKNTKFIWTTEAENAFLYIKSRLVSRPILKTPDFDLPFAVAVNEPDQAIVAVLLQSH